MSFAFACIDAAPPVDPGYAAEIEEWRGKRLARLTAEDGWLTLTGLYWLEEGANSFGSAKDNAVVLPDENIPAIAGRLVLDPEGVVTLIAEPGADLRVSGETPSDGSLNSDAEGPPDLIAAGRIIFYIIDRQGRLGVRVKDPEARARSTFAGIEHFPIDESCRVEAP